MAHRFEALGNGSTGTGDQSVGQILLADTGTLYKSPESGAQLKVPGKDQMPDKPVEVAQFFPFPIPRGDGPQGKPKTPEEKISSEASSLATQIKGYTTRGGKISETDRDSMHSEFHKQIAKTDGQPVEKRAAALRQFVGELNKSLRTGEGKLSFSEVQTGSGDKLAFSLVDKGDGDLSAKLPERTVYDTMEYNLKKGEQVVQNVPDRNDLPADLRNTYDFNFHQAREHLMKNKYGPALEAVVKDAGLRELKTQADMNKALGLAPDATQTQFHKELEKRMMAKLGKPGEDYNQMYSQDVDRTFVEKLSLKPGVATKADIVAALQKLKPSVPADFKPKLPEVPK